MPALAALYKADSARRSLSFFNTHTHESLSVSYYDHGQYQPAALARINSILRDHRTDTIKPIDTQLLDVLFALKSKIKPGEPFHIISGYRSPVTNEMLRKNTNGVARTSYHVLGKAIDVRLPGYCTERLRNQCIRLRSGGVGFYPASDFIHLDTGPVRTW